MKSAHTGFFRKFNADIVVPTTAHNVTSVRAHGRCIAVSSTGAERANAWIRIAKRRSVRRVHEVFRCWFLHGLVVDVKGLAFVPERYFGSGIEAFLEVRSNLTEGGRKDQPTCIVRARTAVTKAPARPFHQFPENLKGRRSLSQDGQTQHCHYSWSNSTLSL